MFFFWAASSKSFSSSYGISRAAAAVLSTYIVYRRRQQEGRLFSPDKRDGNHWLHLNKKHTHYSDHVQASVDLSIICPGHHRSQVGLEGDLGNIIIFLHGAQKY